MEDGLGVRFRVIGNTAPCCSGTVDPLEHCSGISAHRDALDSCGSDAPPQSNEPGS